MHFCTFVQLTQLTAERIHAIKIQEEGVDPALLPRGAILQVNRRGETAMNYSDMYEQKRISAAEAAARKNLPLF